MNEARWFPGVHRALSELRRSGADVRRTVYRGVAQRGTPYAAGVGVLDGQARTQGAIVWYRLDGRGELHWMAQPLVSDGYAGVQRDD